MLFLLCLFGNQKRLVDGKNDELHKDIKGYKSKSRKESINLYSFAWLAKYPLAINPYFLMESHIYPATCKILYCHVIVKNLIPLFSCLKSYFLLPSFLYFSMIFLVKMKRKRGAYSKGRKQKAYSARILSHLD